MPIKKSSFFCSTALLLFCTVGVSAQLGGSRSGSTGARPVAELTTLSSQTAQSFIVVEGKAVLDIKPSRLRIILAVTSEAPTSKECRQNIHSQFEVVRNAWEHAGIPADNIVEDFISVIPEYKFELERQDKQSVAVEKKVGYLMQSNVHLSVGSDDEAMKVLDIAFANGITDIIGFDYWSKDIDNRKKEARKMAIKAAREKADVLLELFDERPPVINIREATRVRRPKSMYESFENSASAEFQRYYVSNRNTSTIRLPRPKNTYYSGNRVDADIQSAKLPMKAELSIVSEVQIYYQSPAAAEYNAAARNN